MKNRFSIYEGEMQCNKCGKIVKLETACAVLKCKEPGCDGKLVKPYNYEEEIYGET